MDLSFSVESIEWDTQETSLLDSLFTTKESVTRPKQNVKKPKRAARIGRWYKRPGVRVSYEMWLECLEEIIETTSPALVIFDHIRTVLTEVTGSERRFLSTGCFRPSVHEPRQYFQDYTELKFQELYGEHYEMKMTGTVINEEIVVETIRCLYDLPGGDFPTQESQFVYVSGEFRIATSPIDYEPNECFFACLGEILGSEWITRFKSMIKYVPNTKISPANLHSLKNIFTKARVNPVVNGTEFGSGLTIPLILHDGHYFHDYGPASYVQHDFTDDVVERSKILAYDFETVLDDAIPYMFSWYDGEKSGCYHGINTQQLMDKVMLLLNDYADRGFTFIGYNSQKYDNLILLKHFNLDKTSVIKGKGNSLLDIQLRNSHFVDVFKFTGRSLADSCKMMEVSSPKTTMDHESITTEFLETGNIIVTPQMKEYSIKDVTSMYEVWMKLSSHFESLGFDTSHCISLPQMVFNKFYALTKAPQLKKTENHAKYREYMTGGKVDCRKGHFFAKDGYVFIMIDRNSMYPAEMIFNRFLKHHLDELLPTKTLVEHGAYDVLVTKVGKVCCIPSKSEDVLNWQPKCPYTSKCIGVDITNHLKHGGKVEILEGHAVSCPSYSSDMFKLIEEVMRLKETAEGPMREVYKLIANCLSGKLCQQHIEIQSTIDFDPHSSNATPLSEDLWCNPARKHRTTTTGSLVNGALIYSHARACLNDKISEVDDFYYCDTDSVVYQIRKDQIPKNQKELGGWKVEWQADELYIGGKKLYSAYKDGKLQKSSFKGVVARGIFENDEEESLSNTWLKRCMDEGLTQFKYRYKGLERRNMNLKWVASMSKTIKL